jgi:lipoprotein-anchoring transpeptidase ErfK/SrfK
LPAFTTGDIGSDKDTAMKSPAARFGSRGAALILAALLLTFLCPSSSVSGEKNPSPCPNEEGSAVRALNPDPPYRKADYLFPVSSVQNPSLYVYKSRRRLLVLQDDTLIRDYPIGLGPCPVGDKQKRGDGRTPEGEFFVCVKNPRSKYDKSVGLSYPGKKHATQALRSGLLPHGDYETILKAQARKKRPPWTTFLGGDICIHGGGAHEDWTKGCVALYNFDMSELYSIVTEGTPVYILP